MALNGFLQRLGLQKDLRTRPRETAREGGGREVDECVSVCVRTCAVVMVVGGEKDRAGAGGI